MQKILFLGQQKENNKDLKVFCKIEFKNGNLSISGVIEPKQNGDAGGSCGQIYDELKNPFMSYGNGWDREKVDDFVAIWKKWHLNDMQAGCEHQRIFDWGNDKVKKPCPICGYKYGTAWLKEDLPDWVVSYLEALPESELKPAWI